jgi:hypothetical protein
VRMCLDELYSPAIASALRTNGHDVCAVKERSDLRSMLDAELWSWAQAEKRALVTENVADFAPIVQQTAAAGQSHWGIIYSSHRSMPRSSATIGIFVLRLGELLERFPGDDDFVDQTHWLQP